MQVLLDVELGGINLLQVINFNITCIQYFVYIRSPFLRLTCHCHRVYTYVIYTGL